MSASIIRLRSRSPYFAVLVSYLRLEQSEIETAATDAVRLLVNKNWFLGLSLRQRDGLVCHEVLHAALGHCWRHGSRIPWLWNVACDYVVNLIVRDLGLELPPGALLDDFFESRTAEEVYSMLLRDLPKWGLAASGESASEAGAGIGRDIIFGAKPADQLEKDWTQARARAGAVCKMQGNSPGDQDLSILLGQSRVDWRRLLWNALSFAPSDYRNFDRRFLADELYVEGLEPEETLMRVGLCCDTSGSVLGVLGEFVAEIRQICDMYPNVGMDVYWLDTALVGPVPLSDLLRPSGGGGTDFRPFFAIVEEKEYELLIFLTDGYGTFPKQHPRARTIWTVCAGGLKDAEFPFGEVVRILD